MPIMTREGHCEFDGCEKQIKAKRLCQYHYHKALYPRNCDRPNVILKKKKVDALSGAEIWALIEADLKNGKLKLNR